MNALAVAVGNRLRELRCDAEMSQSQVARASGIHRPIAARMEAGRHTHQLGELQRYARALELDVPTVLALVDIDALIEPCGPSRRASPRWSSRRPAGDQS